MTPDVGTLEVGSATLTPRLKPITLREANRLVTQWHRHHQPTRGNKFSIGATVNGDLVGAVIVGRPIARGVDHESVAEVTRLVTNGTPNVCSMLYAASARACAAMGYALIQTYILASERGTSLRAAGWTLDGVVRGRQWDQTNLRQLIIGSDGLANRVDQPTEDKQRWVKRL